MNTEAKLINVRDLAVFLSVAPDTIYRLTQDGKIPFFRVGRYLRFDLDKVLEAMSYGESA